MKILKPTDENITLASEIIKSGGLAAFPTETVYGLGADVFSRSGIAGIFEAKNRPFFDPLICHVSSLKEVQSLSSEFPPEAIMLAERFWPGPLTLVLPRHADVPDIVTSGLPTVAVRMPAHDVALRLIKKCGTPLAAPSANPFGCLSPTTAAHVAEALDGRIEVVIDGGPCPVGVESTIVKADKTGIFLLRPGGISVEEIEAATGLKVLTPNASETPEAPGQLPYHYSPMTPLRLVKKITGDMLSIKDAAFLFFTKPVDIAEGITANAGFLSEGGDLREAASAVFSELHRLDSLRPSVIIAEEVPAEGLGLAIMDRLIKASKRTSPQS